MYVNTIYCCGCCYSNTYVVSRERCNYVLNAGYTVSVSIRYTEVEQISLYQERPTRYNPQANYVYNMPYVCITMICGFVLTTLFTRRIHYSYVVRDTLYTV